MEIKTSLQHRVAFQPTGLLLREQAEGNEGKTIEGVAIVCNRETVLYECNDYREIEVIAPSCIAKDFIDSQDIKLNLLHSRELSFARCNQGKGTLNLEVREEELAFNTPVPNCDLGIRAEALIENGTYTGCSFEFWPQDYSIEERKGADGKDEYVIRHTKFARIGAVTLGMDPAYEQTSCNVRELYREQHPASQPEAEEKPEESQSQREYIPHNADLLRMKMQIENEE